MRNRSLNQLHGALKYLFLTVVTFAVLSHFATRVEADLLKDVWTVALTRRVQPLNLGTKNNELIFSSVKGFVLNEDSQVLTVRRGSPEQEVMYIVFELCTIDDQVFVNDATILMPNETAREFMENNLQFGTTNKDNIDFARCTKSGMIFTMISRTPDKFIWKSTLRVVSYLNRWVRFFGIYKNQLNRSVSLLNLSQSLQTDELKKVLNTRKAQELNFVMTFLDYTEPYVLMDRVRPLPGLKKKVMRECLETTIFVRRKLIGLYPEHRAKLKRDQSLLSQINRF